MGKSFFRSLIVVGAIAAIAFGVDDFNPLYQKAREAFDNARSPDQYRRAASLFHDLQSHPQAGAMVVNCIYWEGECWYGAKEFWRALVVFEKVLLTPGSPKEEDARYKVAMCYLQLGQKEEAIRELSHFLKDFPHSRHSKTVQSHLARLSRP